MSVSPESSTLLDRVRIVMVETSHPGNVGSAARAMKTMGLSDLVLVAPKKPDVLTHPEATALAASAADVLASARVVETLAEALADTKLAVAMTARRRELSHPFLPLRAAVTTALDATASGRIAFVFGNEAMCLSNAHVDLCQLVAAVPANPDYTSLNVAQTVQVVAYELMMQAAAFDVADHPARALASVGEVEQFLSHLERAAIDAGYLDPATPKRFATRMHRLFTRAHMEPEEIALLRGLLNALEKSASKKAP